MKPRAIRVASLGGLLLAFATGLPFSASGCGGKSETGTQISDELQKAQEESARAAEEYAKEQRQKKK